MRIYLSTRNRHTSARKRAASSPKTTLTTTWLCFKSISYQIISAPNSKSIHLLPCRCVRAWRSGKVRKSMVVKVLWESDTLIIRCALTRTSYLVRSTRMKALMVAVLIRVAWLSTSRSTLIRTLVKRKGRRRNKKRLATSIQELLLRILH